MIGSATFTSSTMRIAFISNVEPVSLKKLIICPKCQAQGRREILGEIDEQGNLSVLRFHKGTTTVLSPMYSVQCSCGEIVYQKVSGDGGIW